MTMSDEEIKTSVLRTHSAQGRWRHWWVVWGSRRFQKFGRRDSDEDRPTLFLPARAIARHPPHSTARKNISIIYQVVVVVVANTLRLLPTVLSSFSSSSSSPTFSCCSSDGVASALSLLDAHAAFLFPRYIMVSSGAELVESIIIIHKDFFFSCALPLLLFERSSSK